MAKDAILSHNPIGDETTINAITLEDLKDYYNRNFSPSVANFQIVGAISQKEVINSLAAIDKKWKPKK
jgi:zinc protease